MNTIPESFVCVVEYIACPRCGAVPEEPCHSQENPKLIIGSRYAHVERLIAAAHELTNET